MISAIHFLLTYTCSYECDHCFLYCSPKVEGTFTLPRLRQVFEQVDKMPAVESIYYEGGEPFLYYPLLLEGLRLSRGRGLDTGIVTNSYWALSLDDAKLWLEPIREIGVDELSLSDDDFHYPGAENFAKLAARAARELDVPVATICIDPPTVAQSTDKGEPVTGGGVIFRGRAIEKLADGLPRRPWQELTTCPHEELATPGRVHIDSFGHVHLCQGLSMGNMWETPLSELDRTYQAERHPICGPLLKGGPAELVREYNLPHEDGYIDECHLCWEMRRALLDRFPQALAPRQVYGVDT